MTAESPFGPVRKWGRMDPNVYLELEDMTHWQSIVDAFGDVCVDTAVIHEASAEERDMAMLTATFPTLADPVNTEALKTAPIAPRPRKNLLPLAALLAISGALVVCGVWHAVTWVVSR